MHPAPVDIRALIQRSNGGDPAAMTEIGRRLLVGEGAPRSPEKGAALLFAAAEQDWPDAVALSAALMISGLLGPPNQQRAYRQLRKAADLGHAGARGQLEALDAPPADPTPEPISDTPRVWWMRGLLSPRECAWLIERAAPRLDRATVYDPESSGLSANAVRTNSLHEITVADGDLVAMGLRLRLSQAFAVDVRCMEISNVLHYAPGERFGRHFDFLRPDLPGTAADIARNGQRIGTAIVYLNSGFAGGGTEFPALKAAFRGGVGDALCFRNVDAAGRPDISTLHAGLAPTAGEKWAFAQFVRDRPQI